MFQGEIIGQEKAMMVQAQIAKSISNKRIQWSKSETLLLQFLVMELMQSIETQPDDFQTSHWETIAKQ